MIKLFLSFNLQSFQNSIKFAYSIGFKARIQNSGSFFDGLKKQNLNFLARIKYLYSLLNILMMVLLSITIRRYEISYYSFDCSYYSFGCSYNFELNTKIVQLIQYLSQDSVLQQLSNLVYFDLIKQSLETIGFINLIKEFRKLNFWQ